MNCKPFDRKSVERALHNGLSMDGFMEKYGFDDEEEFRNQLIRVFSDPDKADKILKDLRKKAKKSQKSQKKPLQGTGLEDVLESINPAFVPVQNTGLTVPYNTIKTPSIVDDMRIAVMSLEATKQQNKQQLEPKVELNPDIQTESTSELDKVKDKLARAEKDLEETDKEIAENTKLRDEAMNSVVASKKKLEELYKQIAEEKSAVETQVGNLKLYENKIEEGNQLREITIEEINGFKKRIRELEVQSLYFGTNFSDSYQYDASKYEISVDSITQKMTQLFAMGQFEDYAVSKLRHLANVLCVIDAVVAENDNIEIVFEAEDIEVVEAVKNNVQYVVKVM